MLPRNLFKLGRCVVSKGFPKNVTLSNSYFSSSDLFSDKLGFYPFVGEQRRNRPRSSLDHQILSKDDKREFMAVFPDIVRELTEFEKSPSELTNMFVKVLQYNVSGGKKIRGLTVVYSYRFLAPENMLTPDNLRTAQILGWCLEMLQAFFLILDDIVDEAETRRGRPCWYKLPETKLRAITDAVFLECSIYKLLKNHLEGTPHYVPIMELFHNTTMLTTIGQTVDYNTVMLDGSLYDKMNMNRYNFITTHKTSYYTFHIPVAIAMYLAGIFDKESHRQAKTVLLEMGHYYQIQDDFLDVFGDSELTGKTSTDIKEGKCTWLAAVAMQRASPEQAEIFQNCYGHADQEKIDRIKQLFIELNIPSLYSTYEEDTYNLITTHIQQLSAGLPHDLFFGLLNRIHKRNK